MKSKVRFAQFHPGSDLTSDQVARLMARLTKPDAPRPLVLETVVTDEGICHFVGRDRDETTTVKHLFLQLNDRGLSRSPRPKAPDLVVRIALRGNLPLSSSAVEAALHALYGTFTSLRKNEAVALQVVLGRGRGPQGTPQKIADPTQSALGVVLVGTRPASTATHRRVADHRAEPRLEVTIRIGASALVPARRHQLTSQVLGALRQLESPGVRLTAVGSSPEKWTRAAMGWAPLVLAPTQLIAFAAWPVDGLPLPGLPSAHPKLLPPPKKLPKEGAEIGVTTAPGKVESVRLSPLGRTQHLVATGGTGSGKSTVLAKLALEDIVAGRPLLLIDPKRQLVDTLVACLPREAAGRVVIIDASDKRPVGFNPLDVGDRDPAIVVDGILSVFKEVFEDGWGPRTEDLLHAGLLSLAMSGRKRGRPHTLLDLPKLLSDPTYRRTVVGRVQDDPDLASFWAVFDHLKPAHQASITAAPLNKLRKFVLRKNVAAILGQPEPRFRLRDLFRSDKAVLVPLNDALVGPGAAQLLGGLIVAEAWQATMERAKEKRPTERPGMIYIDEVQRFMHLPTSIEDALATSRGYGVAWHVALQGRSQVSKQFGLALELNARNKLTFAASPNDAAQLARSAPQLTTDDFQALEPFHLYANLVIDGAPAGWFSARTLPMPPETGFAKLIRKSNRDAFGLLPSKESVEVEQPEVAAKPMTNQRQRRS